MNYLLDTHVVLWLLADPDRVPAHITTILGDRANGLMVSAISALEVATKVRLGKLHASALVDTWEFALRHISAHQLSITSEHAILAGRMPWDHRDPFDRMLAAQSLIEGMTLVTVDQVMRDLPGLRLLTW